MALSDKKYSKQIEATFAKYPDKRSAVMPLLHLAQEDYGWVSPDAIQDVAQICEMDPTQVKSIAGFYTMYSEKPKGKFWLQVCTDLPCALRRTDDFPGGADEFHAWLKDELDIKEEGGTSPDGVFTVEHVMCLAACDKAPMLQCNFHYHEDLTRAKMQKLIEKWRKEASK